MTRSDTGTREWASSNVNVCTGCSHACWYCYARALAARFGRRTSADWAREELRPDVIARGYGRRRGRVMLPSSHDITHGTVAGVHSVARRLIAAGNDVLLVSKPTPAVVSTLLRALADLRGYITLRFSITTLSPSTSALWEPGAPAPDERRRALRVAHLAGWHTSVSVEPMLDTSVAAVCDLVREVQPLVRGAIWIGVMNRPSATLALNCAPPEVLAASDRLQAAWGRQELAALHDRLRDVPNVRWKDSIRMALGLGPQADV